MLPAMLLAAPVDPNLAQQVADNFINAPESGANGSVHRFPRKQKRMARVAKQVTDDQQFYIFNGEDGEGFVIVAANDVVRPILGYSRTNSFDCDDMQDGMKWWLSEYSKKINYAINSNLLPSKEVEEEWALLKSNTSLAATEIVSPLVTTKWDQAPYYNDKCPYNIFAVATNFHTLTGCAATALAQVMKFWEWPQIGSGYHSYSTNWYGTQSANFGATYYDWNNMPTKLTSSSSSTQVNAVATLMFHCGVSMDMDYGYNASGIREASQVVNAVKGYFRYSSSTRAIHKSDYTEANWISTIKAQLDASKPMVYIGIGTGGGHAFVCDGYDSRDYFHFNWGWSGDKDGFYPVTDLAPGPNGYGSGTTGDFTAEQWAIVDMVPRTASANVANLQLNSNWYLSSDSIPYGGTLAAAVSVKNYGATSFTGDIIAMVLDKDGNYFADYVIEQNCTIAKNATKTINPSVSGNAGLVPGRYYVALFCRSDDLGYQIIGSEYYLNLTTFKVYYQADIETYSDFAIYSDDNNQLVTGHQSQICLTMKNTGTSSFRGSVALVLYTSDLSTGQDYDEISLSLTGIGVGATRTLTFSGTVNLDPGTYILALAYKDNNGNFNFAGSTYYSNPIYVIVKAEGDEIPEQEPITIRAKMPSNWGTTISAWVWKDGSEGSWATLTKDGDWYSYTSTITPLNIVYVNGSTWNGDDNQSVDIRVHESTCIQLGTNTGKRTYTIVDCPSDFVLAPGKYVIVANRDKDADKNWYYMTSDLGTASTKRFQAVSTGQQNIDNVVISNLEDKYVWTLEADGSNWKLKNGTQYVTWTSGNSANLGTTAKSLTFDVAENQVQAHFNDGTAERYLSLNATTNNNYFAFYGNTNQITHLYFLPYDDGTTPPPPVRDCKSVPYTETFAASQGDFTVINLTLPSGFTSIWNWDSQYGMVAKCIKNNTKYESESWLISPCIELPATESCIVSFSHAAKFFENTSQMSMWISTDFDESAPDDAQWTRLVIPTYPTGANWNWFESGDIDLSAYKGQYVNIAFCYKSNTSYAPQWEIKNFAVKKQGTTAIDEITTKPSAIKFVRDGKLFVQCGEHIYDSQGKLVK